MESGYHSLGQQELGRKHKTTNCNGQSTASKITKIPNGVMKKRGRPPKPKAESGTEAVPLKQTKVTDSMKKTKRTVDRFKGVTKEELMQKLLPDRIKTGLDILIIGINPGLFAAYKGHHYAGPGNHFWKCINMSGFIEKTVNSDNDSDLLEYGIGFSTIVHRTTPSAKDLTSKEIRDGGVELIEKIKVYQPKIAVFNGKGIYEIFSKTMFGQKKKDFTFGTQPNTIPGTNTHIFVMPSTSARCAQFPRAQDKVHFFIQIKRLRDKLNGVLQDNDVVETDYTFDLSKATELAKVQKVKEEIYDPSYEAQQSPFPQVSGVKPNDTHCDVNNTSHLVNGDDQPGCSKSIINRKRHSPAKKDTAADHPHLIKFLCNSESVDHDKHTPQTSAALKPSILQLRQTVSDDQKNERVGHWVKTQIHQNYDSEPPMGFEERFRIETVAEHPGSDHSSQRSMISAGVSGSTSTGSTSGYGSIDTNIHHAQRDRVEMWVREQQYVCQQGPPNLLHDIRMQRTAADLDQEVSSRPASTEGFSNNQQGNIFVGTSGSDSTVDGMFRPPVPLFSSWGNDDVGQASGVYHA